MDNDSGPDIMKEGVMNAIVLARNNNKAPGPDFIPAAILKFIGKDQIMVFVDL